GLAWALPARARHPAARRRQAAQRRHLAHDPRIVACVRARGDEGGELVDADPAADVFEIAALLERVDERDRVDWLALGIERQGSAVDLRVALAIEVGGVEDLADRPNRPGGEHHRAENGLLGAEILRREWGGQQEQRRTG